MAKSIKFTSLINHDGDQSKIAFKAPVTIGEYKEFKTFEFIEPQNKIANKIEVSNNKVNIFAGVATIELETDKTISIKYQTPTGIILLDTHMSKLNIKDENNISFKYSLSSNGAVVGNYEITLEIKG